MELHRKDINGVETILVIPGTFYDDKNVDKISKIKEKDFLRKLQDNFEEAWYKTISEIN